jgi:cystathionine beta-lyase/cystathionine gamma-synthase
MLNDKTMETRAVHAGSDVNQSHAVSMPIYQSSTFRFDSCAHGADLSGQVAPTELYSRWGNPTARALEEAVADLEGGESALAFASGMAAGSAAVMASVKSGDHCVVANCIYAGMTELFEGVLDSFGVETTFVDPSDMGGIEAAMRPNTVLIYVETPANPTLAMTDLAGVARIAKAHGVLSIADNTWASPLNQRPLELGIDAVVHSATKYLAGHSDVISGIAVGSKAWIERVWKMLKIFGACPSPHDAWLVLRGIKTLAVRIPHQNATTQAVAEFLEGHSGVSMVHYPGLPSHPGHELAKRQMYGFGGMLAFEVVGGELAGRAVVEALKLATHAVSLGGVETLVVHAASTTHAPLSPEARARGGVTPGLIRVSIGLESAQDLIADFAQALASVAAATSVTSAAEQQPL